MTTHDAMLRTVIENPGDDFPRLAYADWLEENGQPERAEFCRVQCDLARLERDEIHFADCDACALAPDTDQRVRHAHDCPHAMLRRRERELRDAHEREWLPDPAMWEIVRVGVGGRLRIQREWHRGFISSITCDWQTFCRVAPALIWTPTMECPECNGRCRFNPDDFTGRVCACDGTGRIQRPFVATAQPIERVTLSTWPDIAWWSESRNQFGVRYSGRAELHTFARVKPLNLWTCDRWPRVQFVMPVAEQQRRTVAHGQTWRYGAYGVT